MLQEILLSFLLVFSVIAFACSEPWSVALLQILIACLLTVVAWKGELVFSGPTQRWLVPGILALATVGILQITNEHPATYPNATLFFTTSTWATRKSIILWVSYAALLTSAPTVLNDRARRKRFCWLIFGLGVFIGASGLGIRSEDLSLLLGFRRLDYAAVAPFGPFVNRDHAASFLAMSGLMGWGLLFSHVRKLGDSRSRAKFFDSLAISILTLAMIATIAFCLFKTGSRGGTHAFLVASGLMAFLATAFFSRGWRKLTFWCGLLTSAMTYAFCLHQFPEWRGYVDGRWLSSLQWRLSMYRSGLDMLKDYPITGAGLGSFMHSFPAYQESLIAGLVEHVHNDWLESVLQAGTLGSCFFGAGVFAVIIVSIRDWASCPSGEMRALGGGALGAAIALFVHMFIEFPFQIPALAVTALLLLTVVGSWDLHDGHYRVERIAAPAHSHYCVRTIATTVALGIIGLSISPIIAEWYYFRGRREPDHSKAYFFSKAAAWDPNPKYAFFLGSTYSHLAKDSPLARYILLRTELESTVSFARRYPLNARLELLWRNCIYSLGKERG